MIELNLRNLETLLAMLTRLRGKNSVQARQAIIGCLTRDSQVNMLEKDAFYCFGMSKMTVVDEVHGGLEKYNQMKLVEFFEYLGRAAHLKFSALDDPLSTKLEMLLDLILPSYGLQRVKEKGD